MRLGLSLALLASLAACDRKVEDAPQANAATAAAAPEPAIELAGKLDMTHRGEDAPVAAFRDSQNKPVRIANFRGGPVLVNIWATWCGPCKAMAPVLAQAAQELEPRLRVAKLETDGVPEIAARFAVRSIPTLILFEGGREVARTAGAMPLSQLKAWLEPRLAGR